MRSIELSPVIRTYGILGPERCLLREEDEVSHLVRQPALYLKIGGKINEELDDGQIQGLTFVEEQ